MGTGNNQNDATEYLQKRLQIHSVLVLLKLLACRNANHLLGGGNHCRNTDPIFSALAALLL